MNPWSSPAAFAIGMIVGFTVAVLLRRLGIDRDNVLQTVVGVLILALVAYTAGASYIASGQAAEVAICQARANEAFYAAQVAIRAAAVEQDAAQRDLLLAAPTTREEAALVRDRYIAALDRLNDARNRNPLPPADLCGQQP